MVDDRERWILADASGAGVVRFACAAAGDAAPGQVRTMTSAGHATFTDALLGYAREVGVDLRHTGGVFALPLPPTGDAGRIARTPWTVSRTGLGAVLGGPVTIVNDVAAIAWSLLGSAADTLVPIGGAPFRPREAGRYLVVLLDEGLNTAGLWIEADGRRGVIDTEAGHTGFVPIDADEFALMQSLRRLRGCVSWEQVLTHAVNEPRWAGLVGGFVADAVQGLGAWSGIILTGCHAGRLRTPERQAALTERLTAKGRHGRILAGMPRALLARTDVLAGCMMLLNERMAGGGAVAARPFAPALSLVAASS